MIKPLNMPDTNYAFHHGHALAQLYRAVSMLIEEHNALIEAVVRSIPHGPSYDPVSWEPSTLTYTYTEPLNTLLKTEKDPNEAADGSAE